MRYQHFSRRIILGLLATIGTLAHASEPESPTPTKPLPTMPTDEISDGEETESSDKGAAPNAKGASFADAPALTASAAPSGHQDCALALLQLLSDTEICLNGCRDAASVQAALPRFRELSERAHRLAEVQRHLPEPTSQDLISMNQHMERFNLLWGAIGDHIHRLEKAGLVSHELRDILHLAPPPAPAPAKPAEDATPDESAKATESTEAPAAPSAAGPSAEPPSESPKAPGTPSA